MSLPTPECQVITSLRQSGPGGMGELRLFPSQLCKAQEEWSGEARQVWDLRILAGSSQRGSPPGPEAQGRPLGSALPPRLRLSPSNQKEQREAVVKLGTNPTPLRNPMRPQKVHKMAKLEEKCPPTQGPAKQASSSRDSRMDCPQSFPAPLSFLSHPQGTLWTDGDPRSKWGPLCSLALRPRVPQESCCPLWDSCPGLKKP